MSGESTTPPPIIPVNSRGCTVPIGASTTSTHRDSPGSSLAGQDTALCFLSLRMICQPLRPCSSEPWLVPMDWDPNPHPRVFTCTLDTPCPYVPAQPHKNMPTPGLASIVHSPCQCVVWWRRCLRASRKPPRPRLVAVFLGMSAGPRSMTGRSSTNPLVAGW